MIIIFTLTFSEFTNIFSASFCCWRYWNWFQQRQVYIWKHFVNWSKNIS